MQPNKSIYRLTGQVQHYAWGGFEYIPQLLGKDNIDRKPFAEYWMGAHPSAPGKLDIDGNENSLLNEVIATDPAAHIGSRVYDQFGELPYLFKILDVKEMLSIQVHPTKAEAIKGFEMEEAAGIPINAPHRNYKDKNHKPEIMVALSEFWLLHGFRQKAELEQVLTETPEFNFLLPVFSEEDYFGLYKTIMEFDQARVDEILAPLLQRELEHRDQLTKDQPGFWAIKTLKPGAALVDIDRGIFSVYFFNIVQVQPGQAVYQGAGLPHAYLEGQNAELMANSDNVLRGGLTPKHIDVPELLKHTRFEGIIPQILAGEIKQDGGRYYPCPAEDFGICSISLNAGSAYKTTCQSAEIAIVIDGEVIDEETGTQYKRGQAFIVFADTRWSIRAESDALLYKAFVP